MVQNDSKMASEKIRSVFSDEVFSSENGVRELRQGLKARGKKIASFDVALEIVGPRTIGGAYHSGGTDERVCELTPLLNPQDRESLASWYREQVQGVKSKFPRILDEFPNEFDN